MDLCALERTPASSVQGMKRAVGRRPQRRPWPQAGSSRSQRWVRASLPGPMARGCWCPLTGGDPGGQIFALSAVKGRLFAGLYGQGLYAWDEQKSAWVKSGPVTPLALVSVHDTLIAGHNPGGFYWSGDLEASW